MGRAKPKSDTEPSVPLDPAPLLTPFEAAQFLRMSTRTLASWRQQEIGPPFVRLTPRTVMYRPIDLQAWVRGARGVPLGVDDIRPGRKHAEATAAPDDAQGDAE